MTCTCFGVRLPLFALCTITQMCVLFPGAANKAFSKIQSTDLNNSLLTCVSVCLHPKHARHIHGVNNMYIVPSSLLYFFTPGNRCWGTAHSLSAFLREKQQHSAILLTKGNRFLVAGGVEGYRGGGRPFQVMWGVVAMGEEGRLQRWNCVKVASVSEKNSVGQHHFKRVSACGGRPAYLSLCWDLHEDSILLTLKLLVQNLTIEAPSPLTQCAGVFFSLLPNKATIPLSHRKYFRC